MSNDQKRQVVIVGGTHGNEYTGVYLIKKLREESSKKRFKNIDTLFELANEEAFKLNRRYVDKDLNRCFSKDFLKEVKMKLSDKGE